MNRQGGGFDAAGHACPADFPVDRARISAGQRAICERRTLLGLIVVVMVVVVVTTGTVDASAGVAGVIARSVVSGH